MIQQRYSGGRLALQQLLQVVHALAALLLRALRHPERVLNRQAEVLHFKRLKLCLPGILKVMPLCMQFSDRAHIVTLCCRTKVQGAIKAIDRRPYLHHVLQQLNLPRHAVGGRNLHLGKAGGYSDHPK